MKNGIKRMVDGFLNLMEDFVLRKISGPDFEKRYIDMWGPYVDYGKKEAVPEKYIKAINFIFTSVDMYCSDPTLVDEHDLDEDQLREEVKGKLLSVRPELKSKLKEYVVRDGEGKKLKV